MWHQVLVKRGALFWADWVWWSQAGLGMVGGGGVAAGGWVEARLRVGQGGIAGWG